MNFDYSMTAAGVRDRGNMPWSASGISQALGLRGAAVFLDTGCSSSLVAADLAASAVGRRRAALALALGVNYMLSPLMFFARCSISLLSRTGRSAPFGTSADGYLVGEGCGAVVLARGQFGFARWRASQVMEDGRPALSSRLSGPSPIGRGGRGGLGSSFQEAEMREEEPAEEEQEAELSAAEYLRMLVAAGVAETELVNLETPASVPSGTETPDLEALNRGDETPLLGLSWPSDLRRFRSPLFPLQARREARREARVLRAETPLSVVSESPIASPTPALALPPPLAPLRASMPAPALPPSRRRLPRVLQGSELSLSLGSPVPVPSPSLLSVPSETDVLSPTAQPSRLLVGEGTPLEMTLDLNRLIPWTPADAKQPSTPGPSEMGSQGSSDEEDTVEQTSGDVIPTFQQWRSARLAPQIRKKRRTPVILLS
ncbi:ppsD [Symbiodinium sp. CCMP2592]|nr:ppsD [Symbiodinium sp. CCMP2592]